MGLYLKSKKMDLEGGKDLYIVLNRTDAEKMSIRDGDTVLLGYRDVELYVKVIITDTQIKEGSVGLYEEIVDERFAPDGGKVFVDIPTPSLSLEAIKKKMSGEKLTEQDLTAIMEDIGTRKLREPEVAFFVGTFFNPGFDDDEIYWMTKAMANSGDVLDFTDICENALVVDKHSIGGTGGKGITPILISILAANGLICPNTSTRAITSPAGTSDMLEVVMPVAVNKEVVYETVKKAGACLVWGGSLYLAPADDEIINVERSLRIQEFQKVLVSIVAKKIAMGANHVLIDLPYGKNTKLERPDDLEFLSKEFKDLFAKFGIECATIHRQIKGLDGNAVGPALEIRETLYVLERSNERSVDLENTVLDMAEILLESTGKAPEGKGRDLARKTLESMDAYKKFWEIAKLQGAKEIIKSEDIVVGELTYDVKAKESGKLRFVNTREVVNVARSLGTPKIKEAGIYMYKSIGQKVEKGDLIATFYSTSKERLERSVENFNYKEFVEIY